MQRKKSNKKQIINVGKRKKSFNKFELFLSKRKVHIKNVDLLLTPQLVLSSQQQPSLEPANNNMEFSFCGYVINSKRFIFFS